MDVGSAVVANEESSSLVEPGEGAFDDPALATKTGAVRGETPGDERLDPACADEATVLVVVVAAIGEQQLGSPPGPSSSAAYGGDGVEQRGQHERVVAVRAGHKPRQR